MNGTPGLTGADAVTLHIYAPTNLAAGTSINSTSAETLLLQPFTTWDSVVSTDLPSLVNTTTGYAPNVWITEYNLRDTTVAAFGTWAHGLYTASLSLVFLEGPRVQEAIHHETQSHNAIYADIFQSTCAFDPNLSCEPPTTAVTALCSPGGISNSTYPANGASIVTAINGYSATGLTQTEINTAALGQNKAQKLTFPGAPTFDGTHPKLYGWTFSGAVGQTVILNLSEKLWTVDISTVVASGTIEQISGPAGTYVTGGVASGGFKGSPNNLKLTSGAPLVPMALQLPAFSITRITTQ